MTHTVTPEFAEGILPYGEPHVIKRGLLYSITANVKNELIRKLCLMLCS